MSISNFQWRHDGLLRFTDMTVDEIGAAVGMADANYFSRMFRKVELGKNSSAMNFVLPRPREK